MDQIKDVKDQLFRAKESVEKMQEGNTGFAEAQQHVKMAEEALNQLKENSEINTEANTQEIQKAEDLLRLIEETYQASNQ
ncbi:hypothetical protein [Halobacillus sp. Marseille-Q1614]|uniref:hypothetical protein n=1 Tax=Halobacillus sp. Marseille-Q1614 TaxID=2709134 RepID=UPI001570F734|nr:hypothetical protein [Halobacillus sp. Marseille-Q1614]